MPTIEDLIDSIDTRLAEARAEIDALETAKAALSTSGTPVTEQPARAARAAGGARRGGRRSRKPAPAPAPELYELLAANDGITTGELARRAGTKPSVVLSTLKELEAAGKVKRSGERRGTRWHVGNPMDRSDYVEQRTAELERRAAGKLASLAA
jgi:hypothetical protein